MATPTKSEYWTQIGTLIDIIDDVYDHGVADINTQYDTLEQLLEGNRIAQVEAGMVTARQSMNGGISGLSSALAELFLDCARTVYNVQHGGNIQTALLGIRKEMAAQSETIKYRNITRDTVAYGGSNVGLGKVYRCYTDKYDMAIESGYAAMKTTLDCVQDKNTGGTPGREKFRIWGEGLDPIDHFNIGTANGASGLITSVRSVDCLLQNASFEEGTGTTTSTSALTGWTAEVGTLGTEIQRIVAAASPGTIAGTDDTPFRNKPGKTTGQCLELSGVCTLQQKFSVKNIKLDRSKPVFAVIRGRPSTGTAFQGTMNYRLGSKTGTLAHGDMSVGWQDKEVVTFNSVDAWYENFREDDVRFQVGLSAYTQGSFYVDEILLCQPADPFDGLHYIVTSGPTDWRVGLYSATDTADYTDSGGVTGEMQYWISRLFGVYMPHAAAGETYSDV